MTAVAPGNPRGAAASSGWIAIGVVLLVVGARRRGAARASGSGRERDALDPESAGPLGTRALAEILRDQGVEVDRRPRPRGGCARRSTGGRRRSCCPMLRRSRMTPSAPSPTAATDVVLHRARDPAPSTC